jgi:hypothetical protein
MWQAISMSKLWLQKGIKRIRNRGRKMSIDLLFKKLDENEFGKRCSREVVKSYLRYRDHRLYKMQYNKDEYDLKPEIQTKICDNYAYRKMLDLYNL